MVILTPDQHMHATIAVMTQLRADNATKRTPGDEYDKFLVGEIALGVETLAVLNAAAPVTREVLKVTSGMDAAEAMKLAAIAVRFMLRVEAIMSDNRISGSLADALRDQVRVNPAGLRTALLFLENPK